MRQTSGQEQKIEVSSHRIASPSQGGAIELDSFPKDDRVSLFASGDLVSRMERVEKRLDVIESRPLLGQN